MFGFYYLNVTKIDSSLYIVIRMLPLFVKFYKGEINKIDCDRTEKTFKKSKK